MRVAFRLDASKQIGTGHFVRCLTVANWLKRRGAHTRFICYPLPQSLIDQLDRQGHEYYPISELAEVVSKSKGQANTHGHWIPTSLDTDAQITIQALAGSDWDTLVVDHYALDIEWESVLRPYAKKIFVIDDLADRNHDCDFLLDQNFYLNYEDRYQSKVPQHCRLLLGPKYCLLRDEFIETHQVRNSSPNIVNEILVFMGGVDFENYTMKVLNSLLLCNLNNCSVNVVIGDSHPDLIGIQKICKKQGFNCFVQTQKMANLIVSADLAIGAGGTAVWERCYLGLPTITLEVAKNQKRLIKDAAAQGLIYGPEINQEDFEGSLANHIAALMENPSLRQLIASSGQYAIDGFGVSRVMDELYPQIELRKATINDLDILYHWRNHPSIRSASANSEIISLEQHSEWFKKVITAPDRHILIAQKNDGNLLGMIRFDEHGTEVEISIYIAPDLASQGVGSKILRAGERWVFENRKGITGFRAKVLGGNKASHHLFQKLGYQNCESTYKKEVKYET
ncbi:UDP-2,4-diacetamido-2,4,6-trideoxy-beta-L-altropyranose hydrolase [Polynucleobacter sp. UB-Tiil-W10]|uniref:UDP-2,4-diacetamido-2,4, 6-trideoxy-beta-L-altropyranose hydrolase n=1 Tax=Polynucleobacter sp. UB-Tiil-W10 TaxID=1855648 RepID=UPI001C0AB642|nr:UDP-2,4-diacetamido-2,4,6-trideoxy-beta-L-altropyranose hydrolase [Polynucleobacter sp. UB-Tiil-W10]MBU3540800.1 UDP-2,4-diacetamido-2,4,6-trideoxy-beta-L-altropyranose hydrolase [Polynucleobacter sp. UB-Tiil-W10]